ncbi:M23 family metallopeptidase [soil metagenome]
MTSAHPLGGPGVLRLVAVILIALLGSALPAGSATANGVGQDPDPVGVWPLRPDPEVVAPFDPPSSPYAAGHRGVDLAGAPDQLVLTALDGTVTYAAPLAGRGVVVVDHGATRTTYQPVTASVTVGDTVQAGDPIGRLEVAGSHCPPRACLHWGWVEGETYLDPLRLVGGGPVRLLPLWGELPASPLFGGPGLPTAALPYAAWRPVLALWGPLGAA